MPENTCTGESFHRHAEYSGDTQSIPGAVWLVKEQTTYRRGSTPTEDVQRLFGRRGAYRNYTIVRTYSRPNTAAMPTRTISRVPTETNSLIHSWPAKNSRAGPKETTAATNRTATANRTIAPREIVIRDSIIQNTPQMHKLPVLPTIAGMRDRSLAGRPTLGYLARSCCFLTWESTWQ